MEVVASGVVCVLPSAACELCLVQSTALEVVASGAACVLLMGAAIVLVTVQPSCCLRMLLVGKLHSFVCSLCADDWCSLCAAGSGSLCVAEWGSLCAAE